MEQNFTVNQNPIANGSQMPPPQEPRSGAGPLAGALVVVILLAAGGLYFWGTKMNKEMGTVPYIIGDSNESEGSADMQVTVSSDTSAGLPAQNTSDELSSIEADLNAMNLEQFESSTEAELGNIQ